MAPGEKHRRQSGDYPRRAGGTLPAPVEPCCMSTVFNFTFVPWFRSVAPYIHMHRGKTFVVAMAGEAIAAGKL